MPGSALGFIFMISLNSPPPWENHHPHFSDENTEAQREARIGSRPLGRNSHVCFVYCAPRASPSRTLIGHLKGGAYMSASLGLPFPSLQQLTHSSLWLLAGP